MVHTMIKLTEKFIPQLTVNVLALKMVKICERIGKTCRIDHRFTRAMAESLGGSQYS